MELETARVRVLSYKLARIAGHKERGCPSTSLNSWAGASTQHMTSEVPTHKDWYIKGESGFVSLFPRTDPCKLNEQLAVGELERVHQVVESAPTHQGSLARSGRYSSLTYLTCHSIAVQPAPWSEAKALAHRVGLDPEFRWLHHAQISFTEHFSNSQPYRTLRSRLLPWNMNGGGSSQSGGYCLHRAAGYFSLSELLSGCRRYGGFGVGKSSEAGGRNRRRKPVHGRAHGRLGGFWLTAWGDA